MSASETSTLQPNTPVPDVPQQSTSSVKTPILNRDVQESSVTKSGPRSAGLSDVEGAVGETSENTKSGRRSFFGLGKKKADNKLNIKKKDGNTLASSSDQMNSAVDSPLAEANTRRSPPPSHHPYNLPTSPHRNVFSSSPRIISPAGSQIFERDVLEDVPLVPNAAAIPSHIQTEDHIPAVLDASSEAITNENLDPDTVEIVMHSAHQPAAVTVTGVTSDPSAVWGEESTGHLDKEDATTGYGALDSNDVRRLSFISFQDIVQSEHAEHAGNRDSIYVAGLSTLSSTHNRSPSPIRSPVSSQGRETSPPTSQSASIAELSPKVRPLGSPLQSTHPAPNHSGELTIETMTQALRRTGSGDLSGGRSQPLSPSSPTEGPSDRTLH